MFSLFFIRLSLRCSYTAIRSTLTSLFKGLYSILVLCIYRSSHLLIFFLQQITRTPNNISNGFLSAYILFLKVKTISALLVLQNIDSLSLQSTELYKFALLFTGIFHIYRLCHTIFYIQF